MKCIGGLEFPCCVLIHHILLVLCKLQEESPCQPLCRMLVAGLVAFFFTALFLNCCAMDEATDFLSSFSGLESCFD